jgi:hypothetical protein
MEIYVIKTIWQSAHTSHNGYISASSPSAESLPCNDKGAPSNLPGGYGVIRRGQAGSMLRSERRRAMSCLGGFAKQNSTMRFGGGMGALRGRGPRRGGSGRIALGVLAEQAFARSKSGARGRLPPSV